MIIRNFNYSLTKITAMAVDTNSNEHLWVGFEKNSSDICKLRKVSSHNPTQIYYEIDVSVDEIKDIIVFGSYAYVLVDDSTYIYKRYSLTSPLTSSTSVNLPVDANETPIAMVDDGTYIYILLPGSSSGEYAKIYKYTSSGTLNDTIELTTINNASSLTIDSNNEIWVVTNESPSDLVRVYETSGGNYTYTTTSLL